jgi:hypothetical protein
MNSEVIVLLFNFKEKYNLWHRRIKKMMKEHNELKGNLKGLHKEMELYQAQNQNFSSIQSFNTNMEIPFNVNVCKDLVHLTLTCQPIEP